MRQVLGILLLLVVVGGILSLLPTVKGSKTYPNGSTYVGEFRVGERNGQGTLTQPSGAKYVGQFKNDKFNGQGTITFADGKKYVGEFRDGTFKQGTLTQPSGAKYVGQFKDDKFNGQGTITFADGAKYVGEFRDGTFNGQGTFTFTNGSSSSGRWADGNFVGTVADRTVADQDFVKMENNGGVYVVPVRFNDSITLDAIVDSGAADISIPADVVLTLMRTKTILQADFLGEQIYILADGSRVPSQQFRFRSLKVGNKIVENVVASIASVNGEILLGQSFLNRFKSWSVDNQRHLLILR